MLEASERRQLDELGYLVLPGFVSSSMLAELRERVEALWAQEGEQAGSEFRHEPGTRRLANLVDKGRIFAELVAMPAILERVEHVIGPACKLANRTDRCRRALHAFYTRRDKPQQQYQKALLRPETIAALTPLQRRVLAIDDAENDRLSSATSRMSGFLK